jgi:hypothetical protein
VDGGTSPAMTRQRSFQADQKRSELPDALSVGL